MKIMVITSRKRVETYSDVASLPTDWELIWVGYDMSVDEMLAKAGDADAILVDAITPVPGELIRRMPNLKIIHSEGVGYNAIDIKTARECNIDVCNNKGCNKHAVAEQAILMMLAVTRHEVEGHQAVLDGQQIDKKTQWSMEGIQELGSMHVGILGMGDIGLETARLCKAFGCKVSYNKRHPYDRKMEEAYGIGYLSADELLAACDIVSLHLPVSDETYGYMNRERFTLMKKTAILINTARGEIVDNEALLWALRSGEIKAAGLETLAPEPVSMDNTIVVAMKSDPDLANKITLSPHIGGLTYQTFTQIYTNVWENFKAVENGHRPKNVVN